MDFSQLSDDELRAIQSGDFSSLSDRTLQMLASGSSEQPTTDTGRGVARAGLQGLTFGFGDEATAGVAAVPAWLGQFARRLTGQDVDMQSLGNIYKDILQSERQGLEQFREERKGLAAAAELAGGVATGGAGGIRALGSQAAKRLPTWLSTLAVGGAEGALYGAGTATEGERGQGAAVGGAIGAAAAPVASGVARVMGRMMGDVGTYVAKRLSDTPENEAKRLIREAAESSGLKADEIVARYERLGPEGLLMDTDDNFRKLVRGMADKMGPVSRQARGALENRQFGQVNRLVREIEDASGLAADDFIQGTRAIAQRRAEQAGPLYRQAFGASEPSQAMLDLAERPSLKSALSRAKRMAADEGELITRVNEEGVEEVVPTFQAFHFAKMAIDDEISDVLRRGRRSEARSLIKLKNELLEEMDEVSPDYRMARELFAGDTALLQAAEEGRNFFKMPLDEMRDTVNGLGDSELQMFRHGAVKSIIDKLEDAPMNIDNAKKLINRQKLQGKLNLIFKDEAAADRFLESALRERDFTISRGFMGGSQTSRNLASQEGLQDATSGMSAVMRGDTVSAATQLLQKLIQKDPTPEAMQEAADILLDSGMAPETLRNILTQSRVLDALPAGTTIDQFFRGAVVPAGQAASQTP